MTFEFDNYTVHHIDGYTAIEWDDTSSLTDSDWDYLGYDVENIEITETRINRILN